MLSPPVAAWLAALAAAAAAVGWCARAPQATVASLALGFWAAGLALGGDARDRALHTALRALLERHAGGFAIETLGPGGIHDPVPTRVVLAEDAAIRDDFVSLRGDAVAAYAGGAWHEVTGGVSLSVGGTVSPPAALKWRAGRTIEAPITFRRPARYLNDGVPDHEQVLALDGTTLFGSIKSSLLIDVAGDGTWIEERAADVRARVRESVVAWVAPHGAVSAAIVAAILIGDRTGLPEEVRERLQAAGTYHVIAISGGNIAILAAIVLGVVALAGVRGRGAAALAIGALTAYAAVVSAGPSVWRATLMAIVYLAARVLDHRTPPRQAVAMAAALMVALNPLDLRDAGFLLTFGATVALLEGARRGSALASRRGLARFVAGSVVATLAVEAALLPVSAQVFSRITLAGLVLNLIAVPAMTAVQIAGLVVVVASGVEWLAAPAAALAHAAATVLVGSARLVDVAPWLTARVPAPGPALLVAYYAALAAVLLAPRADVRRAAAVSLVGVLGAMIGGPSAWRAWATSASTLRLTMFDVGQGEAMLLEAPGSEPLMIDAGGAPFGTSGFDVGARVLAPALWARGVGSIGALLITHGDPDHLGGAPALVRDFVPRALWEGIQVPAHAPMAALIDQARAAGAAVRALRAGDAFTYGAARLRVLHPPEPDWERPRVRNDDSVVVEVVYRDVAILLTGDVSADVERAILPQLTPAPVRVLKVAHHGSRTSSSRELLEAWRPQYALVSAGRGNTFGHPAPQVLERLEAIGATVLRTDRHGQITVETDGRQVRVRSHLAIDD